MLLGPQRVRRAHLEGSARQLALEPSDDRLGRVGAQVVEPRREPCGEQTRATAHLEGLGEGLGEGEGEG